MRTSCFDTDFVLQMKLAKLPLIHCFEKNGNLMVSVNKPFNVPLESWTSILSTSDNGELQMRYRDSYLKYYFKTSKKAWTFKFPVYLCFTSITISLSRCNTYHEDPLDVFPGCVFVYTRLGEPTHHVVYCWYYVQHLVLSDDTITYQNNMGFKICLQQEYISIS